MVNKLQTLEKSNYLIEKRGNKIIDMETTSSYCSINDYVLVWKLPKLSYELFSGVWFRDANSLRHFWRTRVAEADPRPVTGLSSTFGPDTLTGRHGAMSPCSAHNTIVLFTYIRTDIKGV